MNAAITAIPATSPVELEELDLEFTKTTDIPVIITDTHGLVIGDDDGEQIVIMGTPAELVDLVERIAEFIRPMLDPEQYACSIDAQRS